MSISNLFNYFFNIKNQLIFDLLFIMFMVYVWYKVNKIEKVNVND